MAKKKTYEELEKELEEMKSKEKAKKEAESKDEENVKLEMQRLEILISQKRALGEVNNAKQDELKLMEKMKDMVNYTNN
mgnify:FL=1